MREHQIGIALYCALGTGPIRGRISPLSAGGHNSQFSHEDHPRPPMVSGVTYCTKAQQQMCGATTQP
jgi:hypothetical protein